MLNENQGSHTLAISYDADRKSIGWCCKSKAADECAIEMCRQNGGVNPVIVDSRERTTEYVALSIARNGNLFDWAFGFNLWSEEQAKSSALLANRLPNPFIHCTFTCEEGVSGGYSFDFLDESPAREEVEVDQVEPSSGEPMFNRILDIVQQSLDNYNTNINPNMNWNSGSGTIIGNSSFSDHQSEEFSDTPSNKNIMGGNRNPDKTGQVEPTPSTIGTKSVKTTLVYLPTVSQYSICGYNGRFNFKAQTYIQVNDRNEVVYGTLLDDEGLTPVGFRNLVWFKGGYCITAAIDGSGIESGYLKYDETIDACGVKGGVRFKKECQLEFSHCGVSFGKIAETCNIGGQIYPEGTSLRFYNDGRVSVY